MLTISDAPAGGPPAGRSPADLRRTVHRRRADRLATRFVSLGGLAVIGSILAIVLVIVAEFYPLFVAPLATLDGAVAAGGPEPALVLGVEEYRQVAFLITARGARFISLPDGRLIKDAPLPAPGGAQVMGASPNRQGHLALGLSDGQAVPAEVSFEVTPEDGRRKIEPSLAFGEPILLDPSKAPLLRLDRIRTESASVLAACVGGREVAIVREKLSMTGERAGDPVRSTLSLPGDGEITSLILDRKGERLFAGTSSGRLFAADLTVDGGPRIIADGRVNAEVSALGLVLGEQTLVTGDAAGGVSTWQVLAGEAGEPCLTLVHRFSGHAGSVASIEPCQRNKGFLTADRSGVLKLHHATTGKTLLEVEAHGGLQGAAFAPRGDGILAVGPAGEVSSWTLSNPHPEVSLGSLFSKVWYEGYPRPEHVWQSSGGSDDSEPKLGLVPLLFGTLKGTCYALLFSVPLAVLAALYTSQFLHPSFKAILKPAVEIMAALPSVVLGFIAGLWLAPLLERAVPGLFLLPFMVILFVLLACAGAGRLPRNIRSRARPGTEVFLLVPVVLAAGWLSFHLGGKLDAGLFHGDFRSWLLSALGLTFDQRNSLVVGIAMGFAVIPIIFTIAEDSLSNVPRHLVAGSLALGATRWQTALRVVLPTASPGIFSAIMIGFGRAIGETMIVLMATGNTPIMDWIPFNGFRAMSANIAVELPEAPEGGTLYRVLFLSAFLLFVMTFLANTVAEVVRIKLRKRYRLT